MIEFNLQNEDYKCFTEKFEMLVYEMMIKQDINPIKVADEIKEVVKQFALAYKWNDGGVCTTLHIKEKDGKCSFSINYWRKEDADGGVITISTKKSRGCGDCYVSNMRIANFNYLLRMITSYTQHRDAAGFKDMEKEYEIDYIKAQRENEKKVNELMEARKGLWDKISEIKGDGDSAKEESKKLFDQMVEIDKQINSLTEELPF